MNAAAATTPRLPPTWHGRADLLRKAGQSARWKELIAQIREENRRLPALRNELDQAGL